MIDPLKSLAAIRAALNPVNDGSTDLDLEAATAAATVELRRVAASVAGFANELDDGTGFFNSSSEFGRQLAAHFDEIRRTSTVTGLVRGLSVSESLTAAEMALLQTNMRTGPHALQRELLTETDRKSLERIRDTATAALLDADMPNDPEDDDDWPDA